MNVFKFILAEWIIITFLFGTLVTFYLAGTDKVAPDVFEQPFDVKILNDHEVQLTHASDTVTLYLENAYAFDEQIVFIKK